MKAREIKVGDRVRSFDFADGPYGRDLTGERAAYVDGVVEAIVDREVFGDCERYRIRVERRVFGGEERVERVLGDGCVYPPVNGTPKLFGGVCDAVELLEEGV